MDIHSFSSNKPKPTENKAGLPFVMTYHKDLPKVGGIVDKHGSIIESSEHRLPTKANYGLQTAKKAHRSSCAS